MMSSIIIAWSLELGAWSFVLHNPAGLGESFDFLKSSKLTTRLWSSLIADALRELIVIIMA